MKSQDEEKILNTKFIHPNWYKTFKNGKWVSFRTKKYVLNEMASKGDYYLSKKRVRKGSYFIDVDILVYRGRERGTYRLTPIEKDYFIERSIFWHKEVDNNIFN